jgi:hypothetical protein
MWNNKILETNMNIKKTALLIFMSFISSGIFYSCAEHSKSTVDLNDMEQNSRYRLLVNAHTNPDSLRMAEDKAMLQKAEGLFYKSYAVKGRRLERTFEKEEEINVPASESRTDVEPFNKIQPRRDNLSENRTPKDLLPP